MRACGSGDSVAHIKSTCLRGIAGLSTRNTTWSRPARLDLIPRRWPLQSWQTASTPSTATARSWGLYGYNTPIQRSAWKRPARLALKLGTYNYPSVAALLKSGRDLREAAAANPPAILHENLRGGDYFADGSLFANPEPETP